jgi:hypothetical protein
MTQYFHVISLVNALVAFTVLYLAVRPALARRGLRFHLMALTGLHMFRYVGLTLYLPLHFDWPGIGVPETLAARLAYWDLLNGVLALVAFVALWRRWRSATAAVWLFVVVAMADQLISGGQVMLYLDDAREIGATGWFLLTVYLPALIVSSVAVLVLLVRRVRGLETEPHGSPPPG